MFRSFQVLKKLIARYDYGGVLAIIKEEKFISSDALLIIDSCRHGANFDFKTAHLLLEKISDARRDSTEFKMLVTNLEALNKGEPEALLSELLENLKFQIVNEEYIDFLGRVYRFKEAIYKYMFLKTQMKDRPFTFQSRFMQKKEILKVLRNHYKIYNSNLIYALNAYFKKNTEHDEAIAHVLKTMNTPEMNQLIELRHDSLIGHGFKGISVEEIQKVYGDPYHVLDDFRSCIQALHISVFRYKYTVINDFILEWLQEDYKNAWDKQSLFE